MNKSKIIKEKCHRCSEVAIEVSRSDLGDMVVVTLKCGHSIVTDKIKGSDYELVSSDERRLFPFQIEGIKFIEQAEGRGLIADEMGLGKTVQALGVLKLHPELLPALIIVKSALRKQWFAEVIRWCGEDYVPQVITTGKSVPLPGFPVFIVSFDMLRRLDAETKAKLKVKTVIIDECQQIKNHISKRAKEVQDICSGVEHVIALSGTPIKNNAGEYFTILNILKPRRFPFYTEYIRQYCDSYDNGWGTKIGGIKDIDRFKATTEDFIIRRTRAEVLPDLPSIQRNFNNVAIDPKFEKPYEKAQEEFEEEYYSEDKDKIDNPIAMLSKLRHAVAWGKVEPTVEYMREFLLDSEPERKAVIFTHHIDVTTGLVMKLRQMITEESLDVRVLELLAGMDKQSIVNNLNANPKNRILVASTLAAGEGVDGLQHTVSDVIMFERQWNPANEQQAEDRIARIGQESKKITATYMIAVGTIDEFFTELVEQKRAIVAATLDHKEIAWDQQSLLKDLMDVIATRGAKRWKLK